MNLTALLSELDIPYKLPGQHHHTTENRLQLDCPYCSPRSGKYRLGVSQSYGYTNCWTCGPHPLAQTLMEASDQSISKIIELLNQVEFHKPLSTDIPKGKLTLPNGIFPMLPQHRKYLQSRRFDPDKIQELWNVQGIGIAPKLQWSLFIPHTLYNRTVSWTTRKIAQDTPYRYVSAKVGEESLPLKSSLYGQDYAGYGVIVVEGPIDVWRIGPGAVATFGISYTKEQVMRLSQYPSRAVCYDKEMKAQRQARRLARELQVFPGETYLVELDAKDPGCAGRYEIKELRKRFIE